MITPVTPSLLHYDAKPMLYIAIFHSCKSDNFQMKKCDIFLILLKTEIVPTIYVLEQK